MTQQDTGVGNESYYTEWYGQRHWSWYSSLLATVLLRSQPGPILDVGAGVGLFVECATQWGLSCEGVEGSADAVKLALQRNPELRIRQHLCSAPLPYPDLSFQTVVMHQVIEHLEPDVAELAIQEIARVLRNGGVLLVSSPSKFNTREKLDDPTHINMYSPSELRALLIAKGFQRITSSDEPLDLLGGGPIGRRLVQFLFRRTKWERLSATANCCAYKPISPSNPQE